MGSTMMEEEHQQPLAEEPGSSLQIAIDSTYSVAQAGELVIKQELQELMPEMIVSEVIDDPEHNEMFTDDAIDDELPELSQTYEEVSDVILQRAVSPPTYVDPSEERIEELILYYKERYQLRDAIVELEPCDKIWETLQLIKNIQGYSNDEPCQFDSPKNTSTNQPKLPGLITYNPILGNNNRALPDFRFSVKSKKKLYHCITCGKEYIDSSHLRQHAIEAHGVYVNPKRIYKARTDSVVKNVPVTPEINKCNVEEMEVDDIETDALPVIEPTETVQIVQIPTTEKVENTQNNDIKDEDSQIKLNNVKEKVRCVLCKRVCTDIVYHIKGYHKVGCPKPIIAQCEKVLVDNTNNPIEPTASFEQKVEALPYSAPIDINETLVVAVKKRKRNTPRWTLQKKKHKIIERTIKKSSNKGPFKCTICLGVYKTKKSFGYHRRVHMRRGETAENFDPSKCRFLNSPLRRTKPNSSPTEGMTSSTIVQKETTKSQQAITNYITVQKGNPTIETQNDDTVNSEDFNMDVSTDDQSEQTSCDCGRSFRNYHTMYLHKVKCKGTSKHPNKHSSQSINDTDSGIGISIKIKKNKNDSYEVVPRTVTEENYKDSRSCKDSDASSNDSGMVSVDYNNQKADSSELSKYSKGHSVLRIQIAEDDEEVDIEDGDSDHGNLNEDSDAAALVNQVHKSSETISSTAENTAIAQSTIRSVRYGTRRNNIPSLTSLCKQVLAKSQKPDECLSTYRCQTCATYFKNKTELMEHAARLKHSVKSLCPCGKKFKNLKFFNIHVRRYHPYLLKCSYCMTNFDRVEKYTEHKCEVIEGKLFIEPILQTQCLECKELLDLGEPFDKHMKAHSNDGTNFYQCFKCELRFDNPHQRRSHFSKEHGFSLCRICGKLLHVDHLSKHEAYHDGLGHPCHLCKKAFAHKTLLKKHVQYTHDPLVNEIVKCIVCSKSLKLRYLKRHMSCHLHTEICRKCNKCYRSDEQMNLENHVALDHSEDYPSLKCDTCNATFLCEEHCEEGSCETNTNNEPILVQNITNNS